MNTDTKQGFEHFPEMKDHILRMATYGGTGGTINWSNFLDELNTVCDRLQAAESKLEEMSKQEPVAWIIEYDVNGVIKTSAEQSNELSYFEWIDDGKEYPAIGSKPLFLHPQVQSNADKEIPEGWQLVPKILTREMYQATGFVKSAPHDLWDKLLSVAPKFVAQQLQNGE